MQGATSPFSFRILLLNSFPSRHRKSSPGWMMPHLAAIARAVLMLSPVTIRTVMPARWHLRMASGTWEIQEWVGLARQAHILCLVQICRIPTSNKYGSIFKGRVCGVWSEIVQRRACSGQVPTPAPQPTVPDISFTVAAHRMSSDLDPAMLNSSHSCLVCYGFSA